MAAMLFHLCVAGLLVVAVSAASVADPRLARADDSSREDAPDRDISGELTRDLCGPNGDPIACILGAFFGDTQLARGYQRIGKKMILPLLVGILLKVASFVPLILGKLSLLALASIVASKLALVISAIVGTKKLYAAGHGMAYGHPTHHDWEHAGSETHLSYADFPHHSAAQAFAHAHSPHRRVAPSMASMAMGRSLGDSRHSEKISEGAPENNKDNSAREVGTQERQDSSVNNAAPSQSAILEPAPLRVRRHHSTRRAEIHAELSRQNTLS